MASIFASKVFSDKVKLPIADKLIEEAKQDRKDWEIFFRYSSGRVTGTWVLCVCMHVCMPVHCFFIFHTLLSSNVCCIQNSLSRFGGRNSVHPTSLWCDGHILPTARGVIHIWLQRLALLPVRSLFVAHIHRKAAREKRRFLKLHSRLQSFYDCPSPAGPNIYVYCMYTTHFAPEKIIVLLLLLYCVLITLIKIIASSACGLYDLFYHQLGRLENFGKEMFDKATRTVVTEKFLYKESRHEKWWLTHVWDIICISLIALAASGKLLLVGKIILVFALSLGVLHVILTTALSVGAYARRKQFKSIYCKHWETHRYIQSNRQTVQRRYTEFSLKILTSNYFVYTA